MAKRAVQAISNAFKGLSAVNKLKAEIELLTRCSSDTVYRLRYDTMQYDYISPSVTRLLGYTVEELAQNNMRSLILETRIISDGMRLVESYTGLEESRKRGDVQKWQADYLMKTKDGRHIWVADISYPWFNEKGAIIGSVGSLRDITERMEVEQKIREEILSEAIRDEVTGLAGKHMFWNRLEEETCRIQRTHSDLALLLIDIDQFETIRENYGQEMGDTVLQGIAKLIGSALRDIDLAARVSGEEFGIILAETGAEGALKVAKRIRDMVAHHTFFIGASKTKAIGCTVSIGTASTKFSQQIDAASMYKLADMRLYVAKHSGPSQIFSDELAGNIH